MEFFLSLILWALVGIAAIYIAYIPVKLFAENDVIWTVVQEGRTKAILANQEFSHFVMSFSGYCFAVQDRKSYPLNEGDLRRDNKSVSQVGNDETHFYHPWDVVPDVRGVSRPHWLIRWIPDKVNVFKGIRFVGIPPAHEVHKYNFKWTSLEEAGTEEYLEVVRREASQIRKIAVTTDKVLDYIQLKDDVFFIRLEQAETAQLVPLNAGILLTIRIRNPYLALFCQQHWLEAISGQITGRARKHFGQETFQKLIKPEAEPPDLETAIKDQAAFEILSDKNLGGIRTWAREEYGAEVRLIQIVNVDPGSDLAQDFIRAATLFFVADEQAKANEREGEGLGKRVQNWYGEVVRIPGGPAIHASEMLRQSSITTYAPSGEGRGLVPVIDVSVPTTQPVSLPANTDTEEDSEEESK